MTKINRALISVSDKKNIEKLISYLEGENIEIISTGGTYKKIKETSSAVKEVSEYTGFPEIMNGRVKTLNPLIHGAILADRDNPQHVKDMKENQITAIDLLVVNLYPFEEVVLNGADHDKAIENIDVGGPTMIRAAAKNYKHILVITDPEDYEELLTELKANNNKISDEFRKRMAIKAFAKTAKYDTAIHNWFVQEQKGLALNAKLKQELRYGENPHQKAKLYQFSDSGIIAAQQIQGKELSYNNIKDADSAFNLIKEFVKPAVAIIKHANPCGVALADTLDKAFAKALSCDPTSSFGGIISLNKELDEKTALLIKPSFYEVVITPKISEEAKTILASKKNMRILVTGELAKTKAENISSIDGGILVQDADILNITKENLEIVSKRKPNDSEYRDLLFALKAVKHVRSNAVLFAKNEMTIAIGAGQMSRVDSVRVASFKLEDYAANNENFDLSNVVLASDAFFPFADGIELAAKAGAKAIIQPGGSIRDQEIIDKANELGLALLFSKTRHFKH